MGNGKNKLFAKEDGMYECRCGQKRYYLRGQYFSTCRCLNNAWVMKSQFKFDSGNSIIAHLPGGQEVFVAVNDLPNEGDSIPLESCFEEDNFNGLYSVAILDIKRLNGDEFFYTILNYLGPLEPFHEKNQFFPVYNQ